ncbi:hypothetical protein ACFL5V_01470 [Fibrobacterota bacterium]
MKYYSIFLLFLCFALAIEGEAKINLAFLGVISKEEPLVKNDLERQIHRELRTLTKYSLTPLSDIDLLFKKGVIVSPIIGSKKAIKLHKIIGSRIFAYGILKKMEMDYDRYFFAPWKGDLQFKHTMWLKVIDGESGEIRYNGMLVAEHKVEGTYLGWEPRLGKLEPIFRHHQMSQLATELAKNTKSIMVASIKGLKEKELIKAKVYDPEMFERIKIKPKIKKIEKKEKKEKKKPKKRKGFKLKEFKLKDRKSKEKGSLEYDPALFEKTKKKREKKPKKQGDLEGRILGDEELEGLMEDDGLLDLMEDGMQEEEKKKPDRSLLFKKPKKEEKKDAEETEIIEEQLEKKEEKKEEQEKPDEQKESPKEKQEPGEKDPEEVEETDFMDDLDLMKESFQ